MEKNIVDYFRMKGKFIFEHFNKDGVLLSRQDVTNMITDEGAKQLWEIMFRSGTQITTWYCGLIDTGAVLAVTDVMSSHAGWTEQTHYSEGVRQTWSPGAASGTGTGNRTVTNSSAMVFTINNNGTIVYGFFITSNSTVSGTTGKLWSTVALATPATMNNTDTCKITYVLNG